jgi:hypothetical protein
VRHLRDDLCEVGSIILIFNVRLVLHVAMVIFFSSRRLQMLRKEFETKMLELTPEDVAAGGPPSEVVNESKGKIIAEGAIDYKAPVVRGYELKF